MVRGDLRLGSQTSSFRNPGRLVNSRPLHRPSIHPQKPAKCGASSPPGRSVEPRRRAPSMTRRAPAWLVVLSGSPWLIESRHGVAEFVQHVQIGLGCALCGDWRIFACKRIAARMISCGHYWVIRRASLRLFDYAAWSVVNGCGGLQSKSGIEGKSGMLRCPGMACRPIA